MLPPHQRLRTNHLVRPQIDLRLVIPHKLFPVDGVAELSFQDYTFIGAGGQVAGIGLNVIPALFLGVIHRSVRILHQGIGRLSIYSGPQFQDSRLRWQPAVTKEPAGVFVRASFLVGRSRQGGLEGDPSGQDGA